MGVSSREYGVLKLVHPGRHVETYRQPVTAAEIMNKYPRHCIARPDVFKFPWIVVHPQSVLLPGKVFYLVPYRTLYDLLKNQGKRSQPASRENQFSRNHYHRHSHTSHISPVKCWSGITPKHSKHHQYDRRNRRKLPDVLLIQHRTNTYSQDSEGYQSDTSYVDSWTQVTDRFRTLQLTSYQGSSQVDISFDSHDRIHQRRPRNPAANAVPPTLAMVRHGGMQHTRNPATNAVPPTLARVRRGGMQHTRNPATNAVPPTLARVRHGGMQHTRNSEARRRLKSCFRKQDSLRKYLNLRVTFGPPVVIPCSPSEYASLE